MSTYKKKPLFIVLLLQLFLQGHALAVLHNIRVWRNPCNSNVGYSALDIYNDGHGRRGVLRIFREEPAFITFELDDQIIYSVDIQQELQDAANVLSRNVNYDIRVIFVPRREDANLLVRNAHRLAPYPDLIPVIDRPLAMSFPLGLSASALPIPNMSATRNQGLLVFERGRTFSLVLQEIWKRFYPLAPRISRMQFVRIFFRYMILHNLLKMFAFLNDSPDPAPRNNMELDKPVRTEDSTESTILTASFLEYVQQWHNAHPGSSMMVDDVVLANIEVTAFQDENQIPRTEN